MKKVLLAIISASLLSSAFAGWITNDNGGWKSFQLSGIFIEGDPSGSDMVFTVSPTTTAAEIYNATKVTPTEPQFLKIDGSTQKGKYLISLILLAKTTGGKISISLDGVRGGRPVVGAITLY